MLKMQTWVRDAGVDVSQIATALAGRPAWVDVEGALEALGLPATATNPVLWKIQSELRDALDAAFLAGVAVGRDPLALLATKE